jgi:hypothetical protein
MEEKLTTSHFHVCPHQWHLVITLHKLLFQVHKANHLRHRGPQFLLQLHSPCTSVISHQRTSKLEKTYPNCTLPHKLTNLHGHKLIDPKYIESANWQQRLERMVINQLGRKNENVCIEFPRINTAKHSI